MSDSIAEFLRSCECSDIVTVQSWAQLMVGDPDFSAVCTQGAVMAARKHHWGTVLALSPYVDICVQDFILLRSASHHQRWDCFNALSVHLDNNISSAVIQYVAPILLATDQWQSLKLVTDHMHYDGNRRGETPIFLLSLKALENTAFGCLKVIEAHFQAHGQQMVEQIKNYLDLMSMVQPKKAQISIVQLEHFGAWKIKGILQEAINAHPTVSVRARKI